jgi:hypothetical protein
VATAGTISLGEVVIYYYHAPHRHRLAPFLLYRLLAGPCQGLAKPARQNFRFIKAFIILFFVSISGSILLTINTYDAFPKQEPEEGTQ